MGKRTGKPVGRPAMPADQKAVRKSFSFGPEAWKVIAEHVPEGERSSIVQRCLLAEAEQRRQAETS